MELTEAFIRSVQAVFPLYKMNPVFQGIEENRFLTSADQVNVLNSFSHTYEGNVIFGFTKSQAFQIATLARGMETRVLDDEAINQIGNFTNLVVNLAISKFKAINTIYISPPVLVTGDNIFLMIGQVQSTKLIFQCNDFSFSVAYSIHQVEDSF